MISSRSLDLSWPALITRVMIGLVFAMAGFWKVFTLTPRGHATKLFLGPFSNTWIPTWLLWSLGTSIPFLELITGGLLIVGLFRRPCALALGVLLLVVTYGHLLREPLFDIHPFILTRWILLLPTLILGAESDRWSLDWWLILRSKRDGSTRIEKPLDPSTTLTIP